MCENQTVIQRRKPIVGRRRIQQIAAQELSLVFSNKSECVQVKDDDEEVTLANDGIEEGSTLCYSPVKILPPTDTTVVSNQLSSSSSDDEETFDLLENLKDWALTNQFENKLGKLKKLIRTPNRPLQQIANRLSETNHTVASIISGNLYIPKGDHHIGPTPGNTEYKQYKSLNFRGCTIKIKCDNIFQRDGFCLTRRNELLEVLNVLVNQETSEYELYGNIFDEKTSLFSEPLEDEGGKSVEVVPQNWLGLPDQEGKVKCHWPPVKNPTKLVTQKRKPGPDWCSYAARILRKCDSYQKARLELPRAEYTSDWSEAEATPKRKRVAIPRRNVTQDLESSADDSSQELRNLRDFPSAPSLVCAGTQNNYGLSAQVESFDTGEQIFGNEEVVEAEKSNNEDISSFAQASTSLPIDSVRLPPMPVSSVANSDQGVLGKQ
ncbi:unnamed protein product [Orchesella dallaii]|uniref:Uncharacterized protein n=1 Tax=Orchesella dallaii TaxID=48710 RepID=A0ABP1RMH8_9HEXA